MATYVITDYGAVGDGQTLDTEAIQSAINDCHGDGGGTVLIPAGPDWKAGFLTGSIVLESNVELHVERGATLLASDKIQHYTEQAWPKAGKGSALIVANGPAENIAITGGGVIDGQGKKFMQELTRYHYTARKQRPQLIRLSNVTGLTLRDVTIRDSANWALLPSGCEDVLISGIRILNDLALPNCDGIDPDHCRDVRISDCYIQAGDDCIVIKNRAEDADAGPCENITVTNCVLCSTSTAIKIGTESIDDFRNITISNCVIKSSNRGFSIQLRDKGNVENVLVNNCTFETRYFEPHWWGRAEPIYITAIPRAKDHELGRVRNVRVTHCLCHSENGVFIVGTEGQPVEDVVLEDVRIEIDKWSKWPGGKHDLRPCMSPDTGFSIEPDQDAGLTDYPTAGVYAANARDLALRNVKVTWGENRQDYWRYALEAYNVENLGLEGFRGDSAFPGQCPAQQID